MSTQAEVYEVLVMLTAFYERQLRNHPIPEATLKGYAHYLSELPIEALRAAAEQHIKRSQYFPSVSELYEPAIQMLEHAMGKMTPESAWAQVQRYIASKGGTDLHPLVWRAYEFVGGWWAFRTTENPGMLRSQFLNAYKAFAAEAELDANTPPSVKALARRLSIQRAQEEAERLLLPEGGDDGGSEQV